MGERLPAYLTSLMASGHTRIASCATTGLQAFCKHRPSSVM
jgi:hypothetical protein